MPMGKHRDSTLQAPDHTPAPKVCVGKVDHAGALSPLCALYRDTHLGHALNKILKSIIVQFKLLTGAKAR